MYVCMYVPYVLAMAFGCIFLNDLERNCYCQFGALQSYDNRLLFWSSIDILFSLSSFLRVYVKRLCLYELSSNIGKVNKTSNVFTKLLYKMHIIDKRSINNASHRQIFNSKSKLIRRKSRNIQGNPRESVFAVNFGMTAPSVHNSLRTTFNRLSLSTASTISP